MISGGSKTASDNTKAVKAQYQASENQDREALSYEQTSMLGIEEVIIDYWNWVTEWIAYERPNQPFTKIVISWLDHSLGLQVAWAQFVLLRVCLGECQDSNIRDWNQAITLKIKTVKIQSRGFPLLILYFHYMIYDVKLAVRSPFNLASFTDQNGSIQCWINSLTGNNKAPSA